MKISPLNKYYFDKCNIVDKHDLITMREEFYTPYFLKYGDFGPLNESRASLAVCQKTQPFLLIEKSNLTFSWFFSSPAILKLQVDVLTGM